jgi:signal transduction histidine kinase
LQPGDDAVLLRTAGNMSDRQQRTAPAGTEGTEAPPRLPLFSRLRVRLLALVLLAILPALALVLYTAFDQRALARKEAIASAQRIVRLAAAAQKQYVESSRQFLITLSQLREVRPESAREAEELFRNLLQVHPIYANIGAIDADGYVFASAVPATNRVYLGDRSYFRLARDTERFSIGEFQTGKITGKATLNMAYPLKDRGTGRLIGVVFVALDLNWLNQMAARAELPDGSTLTAVDRNGTILVRYSVPESEKNWVGESLGTNARALAFLKSGVETVRTTRGLDGVERLYASTPLSRSGGITDAHVLVGIPVQVAYATANHTLAQNLIFLGIVSVLAMAAAWIAGDVFVLRRIRGLVTAAKRMRMGDLSARSGVEHGPGEINQLAQSFDEMAATLEQRVGELQRAEAELKAFNEELERRVVERTLELKRSNEDLEQFAYVASHDLQEPLRMITNYLQLLRQRYKDSLDPSAHEFIGFALDGSKRMHQLIHDLLAYSRVGTHGKEFVPTDCGQALADALANLAIAIEDAKVEITHDSLPAVLGDEVQLTQLFQNLVGNAVKFRSDAPPRIHVGVQRKGNEWEFTVRDNGIGIAEQDFQRIFVVFQRLHGREKYPGTGIGLSVCKKIVERHGGRIWVESKPGKGTTFHFTMPAISKGGA